MSAVKFLLEIKIFKKMIKGGIIFISTEVWLKEFMFEIEPRLTFFTDQYTYHLSVIFTIFNQKPCKISIPYGVIFVCFQSKVLQHTHITLVLFLSVFNQKSCNINIPLWCYFSLFSIKSPATYTYYLGVIFVCFQSKILQHKHTPMVLF